MRCLLRIVSSALLEYLWINDRYYSPNLTDKNPFSGLKKDFEKTFTKKQ